MTSSICSKLPGGTHYKAKTPGNYKGKYKITRKYIKVSNINVKKKKNLSIDDNLLDSSATLKQREKSAQKTNLIG